MLKTYYLLISIFLIIWVNASSQQLSHQVLVPLAGVNASGSISYSQTVGETAVEIVGCSYYIFTQGFQQPLIKVSGEIRPEGNGIKIYPNPVVDYVIIEFFGETARTFKVEFINLTGKIVKSFNFKFGSNYWFTEPQNIEDLLSGFYLVRVRSEDGKVDRTFKIEKI